MQIKNSYTGLRALFNGNNMLYLLICMFFAGLFVSDDFKFWGLSLRLNVSDFILPIFFLFMIAMQAKSLSFQLLSNIFWPLLAIIAFLLWFYIRLAFNIPEYPDARSWALFNRGIGFVVVSVYFITGMLVWASCKDNIGKLMTVFFIILVGTSLVAYVDYGNSLFKILALNKHHPPIIRAKGMLSNPNSFAVTTVVVIAFLAPFLQKYSFPKRYILTSLGTMLVLAMIILSSSRSGWLAALFAIAFLLLFNRPPIASLICILLGGFFMAWLASTTPTHLVNLQQQIATEKSTVKPPAKDITSKAKIAEKPLQQIEPKLRLRLGKQIFNDFAFNQRVADTLMVLDNWLKNPIIGTGVGSHQVYVDKLINEKYVTHSPYLWALSELGLIGVMLMFFAGSACLLSMLRIVESDDSKIVIGGLAMLIAIAFASIGTDTTVRREFWFLLGIALMATANRYSKKHPI